MVRREKLSVHALPRHYLSRSTTLALVPVAIDADDASREFHHQRKKR